MSVVLSPVSPKSSALLRIKFKDSGVKGVNTLRTIYGTGEETGMEDMENYFKKNPLHDMAFTPDSDYGICFAEKGILQLEVSTLLNNATTLSLCGLSLNIHAAEVYGERARNSVAHFKTE